MNMMPNSLNPDLNESHRLLGVASLFMDEFSIDWIVDMTQLKPSIVLSIFEKSAQKGLLIKRATGTFAFANLKEKQKWQACIPPNEKEHLHKQIAKLLVKELPDDDTKAHAAVHHLLSIVNDEEFCAWLLKAGDSLRREKRYEEALRCYTKVLDDLFNLHEEKADRLFAEAAINYSKVSSARHETTKVISLLQEAIVRAKRWNITNYLALLEMHIAKNEWLCSKYTSALRHFKKGLLLVNSQNDPKLTRAATTFKTFYLYWQGRYQEAVRIYEAAVPKVDEYPRSRFPLLAGLTVGYCYAHIGQFTQGLGMIDAIHTHCREIGDHYFEAQAAVTTGIIMLDIGRTDDALQYLNHPVKEADKERNDLISILGKLSLAFAYYKNGEYKKTIAYLSEFIKHSKNVRMTVCPYPYLMELCYAMEEGKLPHIANLSLENEVRQNIRSGDVFMKGVAYRFQALLQMRKGLPSEIIIRTLNLSLKWLKESGNKIELARTQLELARQYFAMGKAEKSKKLSLMASKVLSFINAAFIPNDLRPLITDSPNSEKLLQEILKLGQEVVAIRNNKDLVHHIISTVNRITGAERGAIFLLNKNSSHYPDLQVKASKNLTADQIRDPSFSSSMKMIKEVALSGKGRILELSSDENFVPLSEKSIRSRICVPMIFRDKVVGVLYHDNRLLSSVFNESDLKLLGFFAAQAAIALDNVKAYEEIQQLNEKLKEEKLYLEEQQLDSINFEDIVGESSALKQVLDKVGQVAKTESTVLIFGETGVGKELVARAIHRNSSRQNKPFIRVFCSALPDSLIPSELFGHEKGAFTGAIQRRIGRFELADGGTIFLDEIGDLPLEVQIRLLRVLQSKEFERVGGSETLHSDFRLVAATNRDLEQAIKAGRFRADLYYRLNVFPIYVPPLRERKEDIPILANYFLNTYSIKMAKTFNGVPKYEMDKLIQYDWPGNVRELENIMERGTILSHSPLFRVPELSVNHTEESHPIKDVTLKGMERQHILWALQKTGWKVRGQGGAAELLDINFSTLTFRMKKLGIQRPAEFLGSRRGSGRNKEIDISLTA